MGQAQLQHVVSMFQRMRNATCRSVSRSVDRLVDDIHTNRVGTDLANTWLAVLAPIKVSANVYGAFRKDCPSTF